MFAPVLGIIYTEKDNTLLDSEENLQSFLKKIQGHAIPKLVKPNTLRDILNIPSRVFNSIHIADNIQLALEEALAFFGSKLKEVLNAVNFVSKFIPSKVVKSYYKDQGYNNHTNLSADFTEKNIQKRILHSIFIKNSTILLSDYTNLLQIYKRIDLDDEIF